MHKAEAYQLCNLGLAICGHPFAGCLQRLPPALPLPRPCSTGELSVQFLSIALMDSEHHLREGRAPGAQPLWLVLAGSTLELSCTALDPDTTG